MYRVERGWVDTAGKCRTWKLIGPDDKPFAEVTTKRAAAKLAEILSHCFQLERAEVTTEARRKATTV